MEVVAKLHRAEGHRINVTASHPALIAHCRRSLRWQAVDVKRIGASRTDHFIDGYRSSAGRAVVSFEYVENLTHPRIQMGLHDSVSLPSRWGRLPKGGGKV